MRRERQQCFWLCQKAGYRGRRRVMYAIVHGSYRKDLDLIRQIADMFRLAGINVVCPPRSPVLDASADFIRFNQFDGDQQQTEAALVEQMKAIKDFGFSYFVNPQGSLGSSTSYELGIAQHIGLPVFLYKKLESLPASVDTAAVWQPYDLVTYLLSKKTLPPV